MAVNPIKSLYKILVPERFRNELIILSYKFKGFFLRGDRFYCNYCKTGFRKFLPKGNIKRENAMCPNCMSLERTRLLLEYLKNETQVFNKSLKVLHFAPEKSLYNTLKKLKLEYTDADINPLLARNVVDITEIPYSDNYFDLIICSHVLGHVKDEEKALSELKRVLSPGGELIIMSLINFELDKTLEIETLVSSEDKLKHYGEPDLERLYGKDILNRIQAGGFLVEQIDYKERIESELRKKLSLGDGSREMIYKCSKE